MPIERSAKRISSRRLASIARGLLDRSTLCAIATISPGPRAHINTAYFAWASDFSLVWYSAREARHSRNIRQNPSTAIAVFDSTQRWGHPDRGIQLFGVARELHERSAAAAAALYRKRFRDADGEDHDAYPFYRFRPRRLKLFHERVLGGGVFVSARVRPNGELEWEQTETYR